MTEIIDVLPGIDLPVGAISTELSKMWRAIKGRLFLNLGITNELGSALRSRGFAEACEGTL